MNIEYNKLQCRKLTQAIEGLYEYYGKCQIEEGKKEGCIEANRKLKELCREGRRRMDISHPELLIALMDAYEVIRDEGLLQEVLDVVSEGMGELEILPESVKLLAYCYYYTEDEVCAMQAKQLLERLRKDHRISADEFVKIDEVYEEFLR